MTPPTPRSGESAMGQTDAKHLDITMTNKAVQELIEVPRHRYLLQAYDRHRNLEHAGRFEEIFAAEMTVEHPVYRFNMIGRPPMKLAGRERVAMVWPYDERCRLIGEDVWEYGDSAHGLRK